MPNLVISLTTIPSRISYIQPCIDSLAKQGLPVLVWIPKEVKRLGHVFDGKIPEFLKREPFEVNIVKDQGPITKLLPALRRDYEIIITADDDMIYGEGWAATLIEYADKYPHAALAYRGRNFDESRQYNSSQLVIPPKEVVPIEFITGSWGALHRTEFFLPSIFKEYKQSLLNDDVTISAHLKHRGIPMYAIPRSASITQTNVIGIHSLWKLNRHANDKYLERLYW